MTIWLKKLYYHQHHYHLQSVDIFKDRTKSGKWKYISAGELKKCWDYFHLRAKLKPRILRNDESGCFSQIWYSWHFSNDENANNKRDRLKNPTHHIIFFNQIRKRL